jgi:outer membrane protein OmpA-like peptidoglycan-associated protein
MSLRNLALFCCLLALHLQAQPFAYPRKMMQDTAFRPGDVVRLPLLLFNFDKSSFRDSPTYHAKDSLMLIVNFMLKHPGFQVEIGCHTDTRVSNAYCTNFSRVRARAVADTLIALGIDPGRITAKGYGSSRPLIPDAVIKKMKTREEQEQAHMINRRVEMKIVKTDFRLPPVFTDSLFFPGDRIRIAFLPWDWNNLGRLEEKGKDSLQPFIDFMKRNRNLFVEIRDSWGFGSAGFCKTVTDNQKGAFGNLLAGAGVAPDRYRFVSLGNTRPLVPLSQVEQKKGNEKIFVQRKNCYTDIVVVRTDYGPHRRMQDSVFNLYDLIACPPISFAFHEPQDHSPRSDSIRVISDFLKQHPGLVVEIGVHTDSRGNTGYLDSLSVLRANYIMKAIIGNGIDSSRVSCKGYGGRSPVILTGPLTLPSGKTVEAGTVLTGELIRSFLPGKGDVEFLHQQNRRTELKVLRVIH